MSRRPGGRALALAVVALVGCHRGEPPTPGATAAPAAPTTGSRAPTVAPTPAAGPGPFARVAVLGASVSAGFAAPPIATTLDAGLPAEADVLDTASVMFFRDPDGNGAAAVEAALAHRPTLVIALDFLFWFAYADAPAEVRAARLERGLALLERLPGTLVVGDLPDMRGANPHLLPPTAVPSPEELAVLDRRIAAWAAARPHTVVAPLAAWTRPLVTGEEVELAPGERVPAATLMFLDGLHANALGTWHLLDLLDHLLERELAVAPDVLRPARPPS